MLNYAIKSNVSSEKKISKDKKRKKLNILPRNIDQFLENGFL